MPETGRFALRRLIFTLFFKSERYEVCCAPARGVYFRELWEALWAQRARTTQSNGIDFHDSGGQSGLGVALAMKSLHFA